ncbi:MAG: ATP-binding cassette domain-containing protein, partial [Lachnospiraceae bacterium]|nr:ATP-binding cassette domain-containing protein [Lachnospiraceae bacterium]
MERFFRRKRMARQIPEDEVITMENVTKSYSSGAPALNGVTLHIKRGEFVFIVGDSGSGKSTLIKLLLRELVPTDGEITVLGYNLRRIKHSKIPKFRRNLGIVFQDF